MESNNNGQNGKPDSKSSFAGNSAGNDPNFKDHGQDDLKVNHEKGELFMKNGLECLVFLDIPMALFNFYEAVRCGVLEAYIEIGKIFSTGIGVDMDLEKSCECFEKVVGKVPNDSAALFGLGSFYLLGQANKPVDYPMAESYFLRAAEKGDIDAIYNLGWMYHEGKLGQIEIEKAIKYYTIAAERGEPDSTMKLINIFTTPEYGVSDSEKARHFINLALNNPKCNKGETMMLYASFCENGYFNNGIPDEESAFKTYHQCYLLGIPSSFSSISKCYILGIGTDQNIEQGLEILEKGIKLGISSCISDLALLYKEGVYISHNKPKAIQLFKLGAQNNDLLSLAYVARWMIKGANGVILNPERGMNIIKNVALGNSVPKAMEMLGICYLYGKGVQKDVAKGIGFMKQALDFHFDMVYYKLGKVYLNGFEGQPTDIEKAVSYFNEYPEYFKSKFYMGMIYAGKFGTTEKINVNNDLAVDYFLGSIKNSRGSFFLAKCECGILMWENGDQKSLALNFLKQAAENGVQKAVDFLASINSNK